MTENNNDAAACPSAIEFGRQPPVGYDGPAWGARAIYRGRAVDILPNRQGFAGPEGKPREALLSWINRTALPKIRAMVKAQSLDGSTREVISFDSRGYHIEACPQASHGYLYLGAWERAVGAGGGAVTRSERQATVTRSERQAAVARHVADRWNAKHPVGTIVRYWRGLCEGEPSGQGPTRHVATVVGGDAVAWVEGCVGCVALTHVEVVHDEVVR